MERWKRRVYEGRDGWKSCFFLPELAFQIRCISNVSTFTYLYLDLARKQLYFPPKKGIKRRNEITRTKEFWSFILEGTDDDIQCNFAFLY